MKLHLKAAWGVELGASSVNAVKLAASKSGPKIVEAHTFKHESPVEKDEDFHQKSLQCLMRLLVEGGLKKGDPIVVSAPGRAIFSRPIELPAMDPKRIPELIKYEASQQIPYPIEEVVWNYHIGSSTPGAEIKATIFAIRREEIDSLMNIFKEAGLNVVGIQTTPLALLNYVRFDLGPEAPCVIIDVKSRNIDFIISNGEDFWQRNITRCGDDINKALMAKFKIPFAQAEDLKRNMSSNQQAEKILQVIEPVFKQMTSEIQRTIGHYKSQHEGVQLHDAILMGQSFRMSKMSEYFHQNLRMKIHLPGKINKLADNIEGGAETLAADYHAFTVPLGLALQGLGVSSVHVNLIPPEIEEKRQQARKAPFALAASVVFAVSGGFYWQSVSGAESKLQAMASNAMDSPTALKTKYEGVSQSIEAAEAELAPALQLLEQWNVIDADPITGCSRAAHTEILGNINKALSNDGVPDKDMVYVESFQIREDLIPPDMVGKAPGPRIHKILFSGTFFSHGAETSSNLAFLNSRIIVPLSAQKNFKGFKYVECKPATNDLGSELYHFTVEGYYVFSPDSVQGPGGS
ncbi:MAG: pilus assembly protein PilM [Planctomycetota bacterium]